MSPDRTAVVAGSTRLSYAEVDGRADRLAAALSGRGVRPGDRIVVQLPNIPEFVVACLAFLRLGALPVFALPAHRSAEITHLCQQTDAVGYIAPDSYMGFDYRPLARAVRSACHGLRHVLIVGDAAEFTALDGLEADPVPMLRRDPGGVAFFLLSGGTTSTPKLIPRTHDDYALQLRGTAQAMAMGPDGAYLAVLPAAHNAALGCPGVLGTLYAGGTVVFPATLSPDEAFSLVAAEHVTLTTLMPPLVELWLDLVDLYQADLSGLVIQVGGARLAPEVARRIRPELGARLSSWFGMAEGLLSFTRLEDSDEAAVTTQGIPLCAADEIRVVDEDEHDLSAGQIGQLLTRGPYTLRGYYRAPEHNAVAFTPDGWFRTGDLVRLTESGRLVVEGRIKDVVNRGGEKVSPSEVEEHLRRCPGIKAVAVVPVPDTSLGEKSCAVVVPDGDPPSLAQVREFLRARGVADYKVPDQLRVVASMPMTKVGKVDRRALRAEREQGVEAL